MMNKVFEVIEAKKIFNIGYHKIDILINPNSYIHASVIFNDGTIRLLAHETKMEIPIINSIYDRHEVNYKTKNINLKKINDLNFSIPNLKKFKTLRILKILPYKDTLFETIIITVNDELVDMFLNKKIKYDQMLSYLFKIFNFKNFKKYCNVRPISIDQIYKTRNFVRKFVKNYVGKKNV